MKDKIVLAFPYYQVSGVPILFARLAKALSALHYRVVIVDFRDGALNSLTGDLDVERRNFDTGKHLFFKSNEIVIMQASSLEYIRPEYQFNLRTRLLFWHLHPDNLKLNKIRFFRNSRNYRILRFFEYKKLKSFVQLITKKNGIIAMDETNSFTPNDYYRHQFNIPICPILTSSGSGSLSKLSPTMNWAYLGRVEGFKILAIKKLIISISEYNKQVSGRIRFFLIGPGKEVEEILRLARKLELDLVYLGVIKNDKLTQVFHENKISTVFAMGTAIIDAMKGGCVVIKLNYFNFNTELYPDYFLKVEELGYCLGKELCVTELGSLSKLSTLAVTINKEYDQIIKRQNSYLSKYYNNNKNLHQFLMRVENSKLRFQHVEMFTRRGTIRKLYHYLKYQLYE